MRPRAEGRRVFFDWLRSPFDPVMEMSGYEFRARMFFSGFLGEEAIIELLSTEIEFRKRQIAKYRYRDRSIEVDPDSGFDIDLVVFVEDHQHELGAASVDLMLERLIELRELLRQRLKENQRADAGKSSPPALVVGEAHAQNHG